MITLHSDLETALHILSMIVLYQEHTSSLIYLHDMK